MPFMWDLSHAMIMGHDIVFTVSSEMETDGDACLFRRAGSCTADSGRGR